MQLSKAFKEAAEAYEILSNPQKRQQYDQFGHAAFEGGQGFGGGGGGMSMDDIFDHFGDIFGSSFGSGGGGFGRGGGGRRVRKGSNLRVKLRLSLEDIVNGVQKKIKVNKLVAASGVEFSTCPTCRWNWSSYYELPTPFLVQCKQHLPVPIARGLGK